MPEKDITAKNYLKDNRRFADVINTYQFHGRQVILSSDIYERDPVKNMPKEGSSHMERMQQDYDVMNMPSSQKKSIEVRGDVSREVIFQMNAVIVTIEEQTDIHYAMPLRVMVEESANYHEQWSAIKAKHRENADLKGTEYLSGFSKEDRLTPVYTIVMYFGSKPWDGPRCLKDILDLKGMPEEIIDVVADYPLHILDVRRYENYELFQTDLRLVFGFLQRERDKKALGAFIEQNREAFSKLAEDTYDMIGQFSNDKELVKRKDMFKKKEGAEVDMCQALEDMRADSREEGKLIGQEIGQKYGKLMEQCYTIGKLSHTMNADEIASLLNYEKLFVVQVLDLHKKHPEKTAEEIAKILSEEMEF